MGVGSMAIGSMATGAASARSTLTWTSRADADQIPGAAGQAHAKRTAPRRAEPHVRRGTTHCESGGTLPESHEGREDTLRIALWYVASPNPFLAKPANPEFKATTKPSNEDLFLGVARWRY